MAEARCCSCRGAHSPKFRPSPCGDACGAGSSCCLVVAAMCRPLASIRKRSLSQLRVGFRDAPTGPRASLAARWSQPFGPRRGRGWLV
jgi:hypothetical protein